MDWENRIDELNEDQAGLVQMLAGMRALKRSIMSPEFYYCGMEDFLLQNGEWFKVVPWLRKGYEGQPKNCYNHSMVLCSKHRSLSYVEGVATVGKLPLPFDHAWATNAKRELIDGTWRNEGKAYLGVQFPFRTIVHVLKHGNTILHNPGDRFALYREAWIRHKGKKLAIKTV
jgi:hypothetical protein